MTRIVREAAVRRSPAHVYFCLTDLRARKTWARLEECRALDGKPLAVGSRLRERKRVGLVVSYDVEVVAMDPPRRFETKLHVGGRIYGHSVIELSPLGERGTRVVETFDLDLAGLERVGTAPAGAILGVEIRHDLADLKQYAEGLLKAVE